MTPEERERMNSICIGIQEETDYNKYATLLGELSELIARKEQRRFKQHPTLVWQRNKPWKTVPAVVNKLVKSVLSDEPDKVEISITGAQDLFREIRIENSFSNVDGRLIALTSGVHLDVTFEAETGGNKGIER
jgi:2'-5' RNA ligase